MNGTCARFPSAIPALAAAEARAELSTTTSSHPELLALLSYTSQLWKIKLAPHADSGGSAVQAFRAVLQQTGFLIVMKNTPSEHRATPETKKPYEKPSFPYEQVFVTTALACGEITGSCAPANRSAS
jgi:hypothetical protein